jgi:probable HAF family extracellular repeat protein
MSLVRLTDTVSRVISPLGRSVALLAGLSAAGPALAAPALLPILPAPGEEGLVAYGLSPDGSTVTGDASFGGGGNDAHTGAFRWTAATGTQSIGLPTGASASSGVALTAGGATVVGNVSASDGRFLGFRWTGGAGGIQYLGSLPGGNNSVPLAASRDAAVIVGSANNATTGVAFRWTAAGGMQSLGLMPGGNEATAYGVSDDGAVVAGSSITYNGGVVPPTSQAFRWTAATGMQSLGHLPGKTYTVALGISADGSTIVGYDAAGVVSVDSLVPTRWTAATGLTALPLPAGAISGTADEASADGSAIVGTANYSDGSRAVLWAPALGAVDLNAYLTPRGVDLDGWRLTGGLDVSADGSAILVSAARGPEQSGYFLVTGVPEPAGLGLLLVAAVPALWRRRRAFERCPRHRTRRGPHAV